MTATPACAGVLRPMVDFAEMWPRCLTAGQNRSAQQGAAGTRGALAGEPIAWRPSAATSLVGQSRHHRQGYVAVNFRSSPKAVLTSAAGL
jgi:hypothetical protein